MEPLIFNTSIAKKKPSNSNECPFCHLNQLTNIIDKNDGLIWLDNKYNTIENTYQTLIIESEDHYGDISNYSYAYNRRVINYIIKSFLKLSNQSRFKSVAMFKNYGPLSGGSLRHPHTQIVGFENKDIYSEISEESFLGYKIYADKYVSVNISTKPTMGYCEFNIKSRTSYIDKTSDVIKDVVGFILNKYFNKSCDSYNLFFFLQNNNLICKVVPRFIVSPYYVGYRVSQVNNTERIKDIKYEFLNYVKECHFEK